MSVSRPVSPRVWIKMGLGAIAPNELLPHDSVACRISRLGRPGPLPVMSAMVNLGVNGACGPFALRAGSVGVAIFLNLLDCCEVGGERLVPEGAESENFCLLRIVLFNSQV